MGKTVFLQMSVAQGFWRRFKGLMFTACLEDDQGLLIPRCRSVHTFFMRYPLDLIYLNEEGVVMCVVADLEPWRLSWGCRGSVQVLEMAVGSIRRLRIQCGDRISIPVGPGARHAA